MQNPFNSQGSVPFFNSQGRIPLDFYTSRLARPVHSIIWPCSSPQLQFSGQGTLFRLFKLSAFPKTSRCRFAVDLELRSYVQLLLIFPNAVVVVCGRIFSNCSFKVDCSRCRSKQLTGSDLAPRLQVNYGSDLVCLFLLCLIFNSVWSAVELVQLMDCKSFKFAEKIRVLMDQIFVFFSSSLFAAFWSETGSQLQSSFKIQITNNNSC